MIRQLDIRGHKFVVKQVSQKKMIEVAIRLESKNHEDGDEYAGLLDSDTNTIWIHKNQVESKKWSTILHEVYHEIDPTLSEDQVITLESGMYQFHLVNKRFRWW